MAQGGKSHGDDPQSHMNPKKTSPPLRAKKREDDDWEELELPGSKSKGFSGLKKKLKPLQEKPLLGALAVIGVLLLVVVVLGVAMGWFGGGGPSGPVASAPPNAMQQPGPPVQAPTTVMPPPGVDAAGQPVPGQLGPGQPVPGQPVPGQPGATPQSPEEAKQEKPLPEDVGSWKQEDFYRARREGHAKLSIAIVYKAEKTKGSEEAVRVWLELLKPLPEPSPVAATAPGAVPGAATADIRQMPPGSRPNMPGPMTPPAPMGRLPTPGATQPGAAPPEAAAVVPQPMPTQSNQQPKDPKLVETLVLALGDNGTEKAKKAIKQIIAGTLKTDDDKTAVETAIKTLVSRTDPESDAILFRMLTAPESVRPADREGAWPAKELQAKTLELLKGSTSIALRTKLAESLNDRLLRVNNPIRDFLLLPDPLNCGAQIIFYKQEGASKEIRTKMEQQLMSYSGAALAQLLKVPDESLKAGGFNPGGIPGGGFGGGLGGRLGGEGGLDRGNGGFGRPGAGLGPEGATPSLAAPGSLQKPEKDPSGQIANLLWSQPFRSMLEPQLGEVRSLEKQPELIMLAATIPQDSTRSALFKILRKRWTDGPKGLDTAGMADKAFTDPGFLVMVKMLPRKDAAKAAAGPGSGGMQPPPANRPARANAAEGATLRPAQKRAQSEQEWMAVSSKLVGAWRKRCQAAALAQKKAEEESSNPVEVTPKMPPDFTLNTGTKVIAGFHATWPAEMPEELAETKPGILEICYIYAEETNKPKKTAGYYSRQAGVRLTDARPLDNTMWLDGLRVVSQSDHRRSVDVFISRPGSNQLGDLIRDDMEADLIIEVLTIEIKDPGG
jgi:hypothetical protein